MRCAKRLLASGWGLTLVSVFGIVGAMAMAAVPVADDESSGSNGTTRSGKVFTDRDLVQLLDGDLRKLTVEQRKRARYFTLFHCWSQGEATEEVEILVQGLVKLLNSLSWNPRIHVPTRLGEVGTPEGLVLRVDLDALGWDAARWERMLCVPGPLGYPYGFEYDGQIGQQASWISEATGSALPYVRGDSFAFHAARPPLYEQLLDPISMPGALGSAVELEGLLGVDVARNVMREEVVRAATNQSGVSPNDRMVERHEIVRYAGAYWKSYDFAGQPGAQPILSHPLGPWDQVKLPDSVQDFVFHHDSSELLFALPNGMHAYLSVNGRGDSMPSPFMDKGAGSREPGMVVDGISCMACHAGGVNPITDLVADELANQHYPTDVAAWVAAEYPGNAVVKHHLDADNARFTAALVEAGVKPTDQSAEEPIRRLCDHFQRELNTVAAAAELGLGEEELLVRLGPDLDISRDLVKGNVSRDRFEKRFRGIITWLHLGKPRTFVTGDAGNVVRDGSIETNALLREWLAEWADILEEVPDPAIVTDARARALIATVGMPWRVRHKLTGMELFLIPPTPTDGFRMGRATGGSDEKPLHSVVLTMPFYLGRHEVKQSEWSQVMDRNPSHFGDDQNLPVDSVSWELIEGSHADAFSPRSGLDLPTEAEWEWAAHGLTDAVFPWGDGISPKRANYDGSFGHDPYLQKTTPCGSYPDGRSWLGCDDMAGNVWEWCGDYYDFALYAEGGSPTIDPSYQGAPREVPASRVLRGGSWFSYGIDLRSANRDKGAPDGGTSTVGFRARKPFP